MEVNNEKQTNKQTNKHNKTRKGGNTNKEERDERCPKESGMGPLKLFESRDLLKRKQEKVITTINKNKSKEEKGENSMIKNKQERQ